jgi:Domain of unknown function (DUF4338)
MKYIVETPKSVEQAFGAHLRYWVRNRNRELACLLWTSPAWKMQPRDSGSGRACWAAEIARHSVQTHPS